MGSFFNQHSVMFTTEVKESRQKEITLEGVSANGMQFLLDYAYTSRLALNLANIQDVLSAASHVQVNTIVEACSNYLQVLTYTCDTKIFFLQKLLNCYCNFSI